jgi:1-pyrroline-5-carboxylate dehydrogenase
MLSTLRVFRNRSNQIKRSLSTVPWSSYTIGQTTPYEIKNLVNGEWASTSNQMSIPNPLNKNASNPICIQPATTTSELQPFVDSLNSCPKTGLHNPIRNIDRYLMLGDVSRKAGEFLKSEEGEEYFARAIMQCMPKSHQQALGEVR